MAMTIDGTNGITFPNATVQVPAAQGVYSAVNSSSGVTTKEFTSIPSYVSKIQVLFVSVVTSGSDISLIQIGSGSYTTSGYYSTSQVNYAGSGATTTSTSGFAIYSGASSTYAMHGIIDLVKQTGNTWICRGIVTYGATGIIETGGSITLGGTLDRIRLGTVALTSTFSGNLSVNYW